MNPELPENIELMQNDPGAEPNFHDSTHEIPAPLNVVESQPLVEEKAAPEWKAYRIRGFIVAIAVSIILLYTFNNLLLIYVPWIPSDFSKFFWNILNNVYNHVEIPFLSKAYEQCLWAINIALFFSIMGNFFLLMFRPRWFQYLVRAVIFGSGILPAYVIFAIFPFKIDNAVLENSIEVILIIGIVGLSIGVIISLIRCIFSFKREKGTLKDKIEPLAFTSQPGPSDFRSL